jgi:hypothetical protein
MWNIKLYKVKGKQTRMDPQPLPQPILPKQSVFVEIVSIPWIERISRKAELTAEV